MGSQNYSGDDLPGVSLFTHSLNGTHLTLERDSTLGYANISWQVVSFSSDKPISYCQNITEPGNYIIQNNLTSGNHLLLNTDLFALTLYH